MNVSDQLQKQLLSKYMIFSQYSAHCGTLDLYLLPIMEFAKYVMALKVFNCMPIMYTLGHEFL